MATRPPIRALQDRLHPGPLALRQMIEDVAQLVHLAALDKGDLAEGVAHGFPQGLRTIENHEQAAVGSQATALQICEQRLAQGRVLRGAFPQTEGVFLAVSRDPQRHQHATRRIIVVVSRSVVVFGQALVDMIDRTVLPHAR